MTMGCFVIFMFDAIAVPVMARKDYNEAVRKQDGSLLSVHRFQRPKCPVVADHIQSIAVDSLCYMRQDIKKGRLEFDELLMQLGF